MCPTKPRVDFQSAKTTSSLSLPISGRHSKSVVTFSRVKSKFVSYCS